MLTRTDNLFRYVLTYKFSQDHIELLFSCIRGKNGYNNNPNVSQLKSSLKRILLRNNIIGSKHANCLTFADDSTANGSIFSLKWSKRKSPVQDADSQQNNNDYDDCELTIFMNKNSFTYYKDAALEYIAGYVVKKMLLKISCGVCANSIINRDIYEHSYSKSAFSLISVKNRGGLTVPSKDVVSVIKICEQVFTFYVSGTDFRNSKISSDRHLKRNLIYRVSKLVSQRKLFSLLDTHDIEFASPNEDLHSTQVMKNIAEHYFNIRLSRYGQDFTSSVKKDTIGLRQQTNKLILFKGL